MEGKKFRYRFFLLALLLAAGITLFLYVNVWKDCLTSGVPFGSTVFRRITNRNLTKIAGILVSAVLIAAASLSFQTITENRILTPDLLGIDSLFMAAQSVLVMLSAVIRPLETVFANRYVFFAVSAFVIIAFSVLLYSTMLRNNKSNIAFLLLFGVILSTIIQNLTGSSAGMSQLSTQQIQQLQGITSVSINNMNEQLLPDAAVIALYSVGRIGLNSRQYDVMQLGASNAKSLDVDYNRQFTPSLIVIALDMAAVTAVIGPLAFLGLLGVCLARRMFKSFRHSVLLGGSVLLSMNLLIVGQSIINAAGSTVPLSVFIRILGGIYLIYLIWKEKGL